MQALRTESEVSVVVYARYSSDRQNEQSIDGQLRACREYAERRGFRIIHEYIDRAMSGTTDNRPEFQRMIADSSKKAFRFIIVWKLDRFARNRYDSAIYKAKLKKNGVRVLSVTEAIGESDESVIMEALLEASAEVYSRQLGENAARGMRETALKGLYTGGPIPLGYDLGEDKQLHINEQEATVVRLVFQMYADGKKKTQIAAELNGRGYRRKSGKPFNIIALTNMLKNRMYIGDYSYKGEIPRSCPAITREDTFEACQKRLEIDQRIYGRKAVEEEEFLLTGKLYCGMCGSPMSGNSGTSRNGKRHHYYSCIKRKKERACKKQHEKRDFLEWYVVEQTIEYILTPERIPIIAERVVQAFQKEFGVSKIKQIEKRLEQIHQEIVAYTDRFLKTDSQAVIDEINRRAKTLEAEQSDLEEELAQLKLSTKISTITEEDIVKWLKGFCNGEPTDKEFQRKIIDVFVNAVYLYDDRVVIYYNVKNGKQISYIEMLSDLEDMELEECSDSFQYGEPFLNISEPVRFFYKPNRFGCMIRRK